MKNFVILIIIILILSACELNHSNPLDPAGNAPDAPSIVTEIELSLHMNSADQKYIEISWNNSNSSDCTVDYYNIYRGMSYYGVFEIIDSPLNPPSYDYDIISGNRYYYKISAVNTNGLEGHLSLPKSINVN